MGFKQISKVWTIALALIATAPACLAEDPIVWSSFTVDGVRLGLRLQTESPDRSVQVLVNNAGQAELTVFIAQKSAHGTAYLFRFIALAPSGKQIPITDFRPESDLTGTGLLIPITIELLPGETHRFNFPMSGLVWMKSGRNIPLDRLLSQGYRFHASLRVRHDDLERAMLGGIPQPAAGHLWTGSLISGEIGIP